MLVKTKGIFVLTILVLGAWFIVTNTDKMQRDAKPPLEFSATCVSGGEMTVTYGYAGIVKGPQTVKCPKWNKIILDYDGNSRAILAVDQVGTTSLITCTITKSGFVITHRETTTKPTLACST